MAFPVIAFQLYNLNDYCAKLFTSYEDDHLYVARFAFEEFYPATDEQDEGSSQRPDKLKLVNTGSDKETLKHFPFSSIYKSELSHVKIENTNLTQTVTLFNVEYNYVLVLYLDSVSTVSKFEDYISNLELPVETVKSFKEFFIKKIDDLDAALYKESQGKQRLQRKTNPKTSKELRLLKNHIHIVEEDPSLGEVYLKIIHEFDDEFLHTESNKFEYDSTTQKVVVH